MALPTHTHPPSQTPVTDGPVAPSSTAHHALSPLPGQDVTLSPAGWLGEWQQRTVARTLPHVLTRIETGEAVANLERLEGGAAGPHRGMVFTDTDVHKTLEAIAWAAPRLDPDDPLLQRAQALVDLLVRVQEPDGYLNSHVQGRPDLQRWEDPQWGHELYTAGHLFQAAVAASRSGVLPELVDVARRFADLLLARFPAGEPYVEGHPEVETALVELARELDEPAYLDLAERQLGVRGHGWLGEDRFGSAYFQDAAPLREAPSATGHAVRQLYLLTGAVDVAVERGDTDLLAAVERLWKDLNDHRTYVTGATGSRHRDEAIGDAFELPPDRAYAESCAAIASFQLNWRLLLATGEVRYADAMDDVLHNALAASTSQSGTEFFYSNPLQLRTGHDGTHEDAPGHRLPWYACACCPPNVARLLTSAHHHVLTATPEGIALQLLTAVSVRTIVADGPVDVTVSTSYPWSGVVEVQVGTEVEQEWELALRIPSWCRDWRLDVAGERVVARADDGYVRIRRSWRQWCSVRLELDMPVRWIEADPRVDAVRGCVALARGPVLYALEDADTPAGTVLEDLELRSVDGPVWAGPDAIAPVLLQARFALRPPRGPLYRDRPAPGSGPGAVPPTPTPTPTPDVTVQLVPYHRWANREPGAMRVWLPLHP